MRGIVTTVMAKMVGMKKALWSAMVSMCKQLLSFIIVNGTDLMTRIVMRLNNLYVWTVSNIKHYLVPKIIVEEYNKVEPMFANKQAGQIGRLLLITVPLTLLLVLLHLILGLYNVLKAMMVKLLKRG